MKLKKKTASTIAESVLILKSGISHPIIRTSNLLLFVPLLATNLIATGIIFYKTLCDFSYQKSKTVYLQRLTTGFTDVT